MQERNGMIQAGTRKRLPTLHRGRKGTGAWNLEGYDEQDQSWELLEREPKGSLPGLRRMTVIDSFHSGSYDVTAINLNHRHQMVQYNERNHDDTHENTNASVQVRSLSISVSCRFNGPAGI